MNTVADQNSKATDSAADPNSGKESRLPGWTRLLGTVFAALLGTLAVYMIINATTAVSTEHKRNFHFVDIATKGLEVWPQDIQTMVRNRYITRKSPDSTVNLYHPVIGSFNVHFFPPVKAKCDVFNGPALDHGELAVGFEESTHPGQGMRIVVSGGVFLHPEINNPDRPSAPSKCFIVRVPLDRLISTATVGAGAPVAETDTPVSHILVVNGAGTVVAQSGEPALPLDRIDHLDPTDTLSKGLGEQVQYFTTAKQHDQASTDTKGNGNSALFESGAAGSVMALRARGEDYLAYIKPFRAHGLARQPCAAGEAAASAAPLRKAHATDDSPCYIVGLIPRAALTRDWIASMPVLRTVALLGLLTLALLLPAIRFLFIGGAESASRFEVIGIIAGVPAALSLAMLLMLFSFDVAANRARAQSELNLTSARLAKTTGTEIHDQLTVLATVMDQGTIPSSSPFLAGIRVNQTGESPDPISNINLVESTALRIIKTQTFKPASVLVPTALDVSGRDYFQILRDGGGDSLDFTGKDNKTKRFIYTLGLERSQTTGFDVGVAAIRAEEGNKCEQFGQQRYPCGIASFPIVHLISPQLADPTHFVVIDTKNWTGNNSHFPIIAQDQRGSASRDDFLDDTELGFDVVKKLTELGGPEQAQCPAQNPPSNDEAFGFSGRFSGYNALFAARRIACSHWVVIAWQDLASIDQTRSSRTVTLTLACIAALSGLMVGLVMAGSVILPTASRIPGWHALRTQYWTMLWPHQSEGSRHYYARVKDCLIGLALCQAFVLGAKELISPTCCAWLGAIPALVILVLMWVATARLTRQTINQMPWGIPPWSPYLGTAVLIGIGAYLISAGQYLFVTAFDMICIVMLVPLGLGLLPDNEEPLQPETEHSYRLLITAMIVVVALLPVSFMWSEAKSVTETYREQRRIDQARHELLYQQQLVSRICLARSDKGFKPALCQPDALAPREPNLDFRSLSTEDKAGTNFAGDLWEALHGVPPPSPNIFQTSNSNGQFFRFRPSGAGGKWEVAAVANGHDLFWPGHLTTALLLAFGLIPLILLLWWLPGRLLDTLAGFGIPLGKTATSCELPVETGETAAGVWKKANLPIRLLVATGGLNHRDDVINSARDAGFKIINLTEILLSQTDGGTFTTKIHALVRRCLWNVNAADTLVVEDLTSLLYDSANRLTALALLEALDKALLVRATGLGNGLPTFARLIIFSQTTPLERILEVFDNDPVQSRDVMADREELRWARLFERYTTICAPPPSLKERKSLAKAIGDVRKTSGSSSSENAVLAFLVELRFVPDYILLTLHPLLPNLISEQDENNIARFANEIISISQKKQFSSPAAAIAYLRDNLIEYYEYLWFSLTHSDRIVLDALARGHFVNMRKALALRSLVRRGLIVLDPSPRLFNRSFAMFVRQAERPDTIAKWRNNQPKGQWETVRLTALLVLPLGLLALAAASVYGGDNLGAVVPAFVAGIPALIGMVSRRATGLATKS